MCLGCEKKEKKKERETPISMLFFPEPGMLKKPC